MDAVVFLRELKRMCESIGCSVECEIAERCSPLNPNCFCVLRGYPVQAVEAVEKWSKGHPILTNEQKFKQVFGIDLTKAACMGSWWNEEYKEIPEDE